MRTKECDKLMYCSQLPRGFSSTMACPLFDTQQQGARVVSLLGCVLPILNCHCHQKVRSYTSSSYVYVGYPRWLSSISLCVHPFPNIVPPLIIFLPNFKVRKVTFPESSHWHNQFTVMLTFWFAVNFKAAARACLTLERRVENLHAIASYRISTPSHRHPPTSYQRICMGIDDI